jgi:hypothetical protein
VSRGPGAGPRHSFEVTLAGLPSDATPMRQLSVHVGRLSLVVCALSLASACSFGWTSSHARESVVKVREKDFRIVVRPNHVRAGNVRLVLRNEGPVMHELILVRGNRAHLPLRVDGLTVDEDGIPVRAVAEGAGPGTVRELRVHLKPGRYQLLCNMAGHFLAGMHAELVVR